MSAISIAGAHVERSTAIYQHTGARLLTIYVETAAHDGIAAGFPVSGDMLRTIKRGSRTALRRRRERAARVLTEHEAGA